MTRRRDTERLIAAALALAGGAAAVAALAIPASATTAAPATIRLSHACYQPAQQATLHGSGFDPSSHWSARLDGSAFGSGTTDSTGAITATFGVPSHLRKGSSGEDSYQLVVREGKHSAGATFRVSRLAATFSPTSGNLLTLKVDFHLLGWGRGGSLYLHYLSPKGVSRLSRYLGPAAGACGHLSTAPLKLFPFRPGVGVWTLQFDKHSVYQASSVPRVVIRYKVG
jgi:hypothetical protein